MNVTNVIDDDDDVYKILRQQDEEYSFISCRKEEQGEFESSLLGPSDAIHADFPIELVEPASQLLEALEKSNERYIFLQEQMKNKDKTALIEMVKEGNIVLYGPSDKEGRLIQYMPMWEDNSNTLDVEEKEIIDFTLKENSVQKMKICTKVKPNKYMCAKLDCNFGSNGKTKDAVTKHFQKEHQEDIDNNRINEQKFITTPFNDRLVCFAEPVNENNDLKFIPIFHHSHPRDNSWSFLPKMEKQPPWYTQMAKKIGFSRIIKMCLFAIVEKSTKEEWNARATDACQVAGIAIRSDLGYDRSNIALLHNDKSSNRKPENCAWNIFHILRLVGTVDFDKPRYEKLGGGKTRPTMGISFHTEKWNKSTLNKMSTFRNKYSRMGSKFMLCPPITHTSKIKPGGARRSHLRRLFLRKQKAIWAEPGGVDDEPIKSLNVLQETVWCINSRVLEFATKYIGTFKVDNGGNEIFQPSNEFIELTNWNCEKETLPWHDKAALTWATDLDSRSDGSRFWHAWCFDWRGRMYSATNVLSPQGNDLSRALIQFHEYLPVATVDYDPITRKPTSLFWIKVNIVEMFNGVTLENGNTANKRTSFEDRVKWVNDNSKELLDIAHDPDGYVDYWWDSDCRGINAGTTTFRRLATLFDYADICGEIKINGAPKSCLPIQQDASSNWLQHTAIMLKNTKLAKLSNIVGRGIDEVPADIYTEITEELQRYWNSKEGTPHPFIGIFLERTVNKKLRRRNVAKKPVMAVAYGGDPKSAGKEFMKNSGPTKFDKETGQHFNLNGMIHDISNELIHIDGAEELPTDSHQKFVDQLMEDYKKALFAVAPGHDEIKEQTRKFQEEKPPKTGKTPQNSALQWYTPTGFFVMNQKGKIPTHPPTLIVWKSIRPTYYWNSQTKYHAIDMNKFDLGVSLKGAPPNFIHSIDAAHMQMSSARCHEDGISSLSMVHDSYGCHAANINKLREIVLQSFIDIHRTLPLDVFEKAGKKALKEGDRVSVSQFPNEPPIIGTIAETTKPDSTTASVKLDSPDFTISYPIINIKILDDALADDSPTDFDIFIEDTGLKDASYIIG